MNLVGSIDPVPYKRHKPVSEKEMLNEKYHGHHTVCQTLREIYIITDSKEIKDKCRLAMPMTKSMHEKLKKYKKEKEERENGMSR